MIKASGGLSPAAAMTPGTEAVPGAAAAVPAVRRARQRRYSIEEQEAAIERARRLLSATNSPAAGASGSQHRDRGKYRVRVVPKTSVNARDEAYSLVKGVRKRCVKGVCFVNSCSSRMRSMIGISSRVMGLCRSVLEMRDGYMVIEERRDCVLNMRAPRWRYWEMLLIVCVLFTCLFTPFEVAFLDNSNVDFLFFLNRLIDIIFLGAYRSCCG